nr:helicase [Tanacetum cinerariifolium]
KGATRKLRKWVREACNRTVDYPVFRYMLEVVVADDTTHSVVMMFNDTATELLKFSAESLMGTEDENSDAEDELNLPMAIRNLIGTDHIIPNASAEEDASFSTTAMTANDVELLVKIVTKPPTVCTPLKPNEGKKQKGHALEDSDVDEVSGLQENTGNSNAKVAVDTQKKRKSHIYKHKRLWCLLRTFNSCQKGSHNNQRITPSSKGLLKKSISIRADTIIGLGGRVQSYTDSGPTHLRKDKKGSKKAAFISASVPVTYYDIGPTTHQCRNCGATIWYEEREEKLKTSTNPTFTLCCKGSKVLLPYFHDTPPPLVNLLSHDQPLTTEFRDNIRVYNNMFSFTSFGAKIDNSINTGRNEVRNITSAFMYKETSENIDKQIAGDLINILDRYSSVAPSFRMARDWCNTHSSADFCLRLHSERKTTRQYNAPTVSKVVAIIINDFEDSHPTRDIVIDRKDTGLQRVSELHPSYMALQYPLLFPYREDVVYVIEFQKRGLPHTHILLWSEENYKCKTPNEIDDIILAEMPSPTADPDRYKMVTDYMLHGPCGKDARNAACTNDGKCSKHFPKPFLAETFLDEDGYPYYHRRDNKVTFKKGKFMYDNKHVVPHNHYLLLKYKAHINVEWCNKSRAIKYLFKYLNKGPDRATIVIEENVRNKTTLGTENVLEVDDIKNYLNCWFLALCEAVWWLFSFYINYSYPLVTQLSFHLPNQNAITLRDSEKLPALLQREGIDVTMFTDSFELNKRDPTARTLTYVDIPKHYVWHGQSKQWQKGKQQKCIGRIVYSSPASGERYYLRMLLNVVKGIKGFDEMMTTNKILYETFKETCFAYGLLNDDKEWSHAIKEAIMNCILATLDRPDCS